jgi:hypothetical protein
MVVLHHLTDWNIMARSSTSTQIISDDSVVVILKQEDFNALNGLLYALQDVDALRALAQEHSWGLGANSMEPIAALWGKLHGLSSAK